MPPTPRRPLPLLLQLLVRIFSFFFFFCLKDRRSVEREFGRSKKKKLFAPPAKMLSASFFRLLF